MAVDLVALAVFGAMVSAGVGSADSAVFVAIVSGGGVSVIEDFGFAAFTGHASITTRTPIVITMGIATGDSGP